MNQLLDQGLQQSNLDSRYMLIVHFVFGNLRKLIFNDFSNYKIWTCMFELWIDTKLSVIVYTKHFVNNMKW